MELTEKNDFGDSCHMASTSLSFMILHTSLSKRVYVANRYHANRYQWEMHHSKDVCTSDEIPRYSAKEPPMKWECSSECKILGDSDVCMIIDLDIIFAGGAFD